MLGYWALKFRTERGLISGFQTFSRMFFSVERLLINIGYEVRSRRALLMIAVPV